MPIALRAAENHDRRKLKSRPTEQAIGACENRTKRQILKRKIYNLGLAMLSTLVTICELGRSAGWTNISKIPVDAIIERWKAKGCEKGQSRRLKKLFADGHVVDAEMEQAAGVFVTVSNVQCA